MYKDKNKQREAAKERAKRYRNAHKNVTPVTPSGVTPCKAGTKRGTDIQCFEDLPLDVQADITRLSRAYTALDGKSVSREQDLADRTTRAICYQHLFPDRFYPGGREVNLPQSKDEPTAKPNTDDTLQELSSCSTVGLQVPQHEAVMQGQGTPKPPNGETANRSPLHPENFFGPENGLGGALVVSGDGPTTHQEGLRGEIGVETPDTTLNFSGAGN